MRETTDARTSASDRPRPRALPPPEQIEGDSPLGFPIAMTRIAAAKSVVMRKGSIENDGRRDVNEGRAAIGLHSRTKGRG